MKKKATDNMERRAADLARLMDQLSVLHEKLLALTKRKLEAIRAASLDAMCACNMEQDVVVRRIQEREGLRKQLMDALGSDLGLGAKTGRALTVSQLLAKLPPAARGQVSGAKDRLRDTIGKLAQANRVNGAVSRELIGHLNFVFSAVRPSALGGGHYSAAGAVRPEMPGVFEAVG
jgi:hypothetical protein